MAKLEWFCMDDTSWTLDDYSLKPLTPPPHHAMEADEIDYHDYALAITGDVFRWMINHAALETLQRVSARSIICLQASLYILYRADACQNADLRAHVTG